MLAAGETRQRSTIMHKAVLGFLAVDYVNGNVAPGVLANYSGAYPHRAHVSCLHAGDGSPCQ